MTLPNFVHGFPEHWQHSWEYEEYHSKQSGLHFKIDFILDRLQGRGMWIIKRYPPFKKKLRAIISFFWGLNCGFPLLDIIKFTIWEHQDYPTQDETKKRAGQ